ncbi:hypothetical protein JKF63_05284 [Porcisia hertigi]|uniref:Uncharacterized protein n=1 Tax=Porcisia hertigi TaxID=2761500 RepID=A0A836INI5_9TRYP|nr:hypothetical protein JKF63_05284 [Porcisia hertigi]
MSAVKTQRPAEAPRLPMAPSSRYLSERRALRVLDLACPRSDLGSRKNCAYLVSQRRMTIDDAIDFVKSKVGDTNATAAATATTTLSRPGATMTRETGRGSAAPVAALEDTSRIPVRTYRLPPAQVSSRVCEREGIDDDSDRGTHYDGYRSARTRPPLTTAAKVTATRLAPVSASSAAPSVMPADAPGERGEPASCTTRREYRQRTSVPMTTPPAAALRQQSLGAAQGERRVSGTTATALARSGGDASPSHRCRESDQSPKELDSFHLAPMRVTQNKEQLDGSNARHRSVPSAAYKSRELAATALAEGLQPLSGPRYNAYNDDAAATRTLLPSAGSLPQRRPLQLQPSALSSLSPLRLSEGVAKNNAAHNAQGREDAYEGCVGPEPLLSELKRATEEERAAFEAQQAKMLCYWYRDDTSKFDKKLSSYGPGQVLFFKTSLAGEHKVRDHCRLLETLLFTKLIPHHTFDIADSEFFQRRIRKMYKHAAKKNTMPKMPLLFVDAKLIGNFETVQELEDCGELDTKMIEAGCRVLRQRVLKAYGRRKAGFAAEPLVLSRKGRSGK